MALAKFQENRFRIDGEIAENHAILVNLTASIDFVMIRIAILIKAPELWSGSDPDIRICIDINPCPAELLQLYFSSLEAGIAYAISSFKWRKILLFLKNRHV